MRNGPSKTAVERVITGLTSKSNAEMLERIRAILENQLKQFQEAGKDRQMTEKEVAAFDKLVSTYQKLESATTREHAKYPFDELTTEQLGAAETAARALLGPRK